VEPLAWGTLACSFVVYLVALQVGPACASAVGPWSWAVFVGSFFWVAYLQERKKGGRR
jgi:hypothetical protein